MARRINLKFAVLLVVILAVIFGGVGATVLFVNFRDPAVYEKRGDKYFAEGQYSKAEGQYTKSLQQEANNPIVLMKCADAILHTTSDSTFHADERRSRVLGLWERAGALSDTDAQAAAEATELLLDFRYRLARMYRTIAAWNTLFQQADAILNRDPRNVPARKYRAIAQVNRISMLELESDEQQQAFDDLSASLAVAPDNVNLTYWMAQWHLYQSRLSQLDGHEQDAADHRAQADQLIQALADNHPDDLEARLAQIRHQIILLAVDQQRDDATVVALLDHLESLALTADQPLDALEVAQYLAIFDREPLSDDAVAPARGMQRSEDLLRSVLERHPDQLSAISQMAVLCKRQGRIDEAIRWFDKAVKPRPVPISLDAIRMQLIQPHAFTELANIYLTRHDQETDPSRRTELLSLAQRAAAGLRQYVGTTSANADRLEGRLAIIEGDFALAVKKLEQADAQFSGQDDQTLRLAAIALEQQGATGEAIKRLEKLIKLDRNRVRSTDYLALASLVERAGQHERAHHLVDQVMALDPVLPQAKMLKAQLLAADIVRLDATDPGAADEILAEATRLIQEVSQDDPDAGRLRVAALLQGVGRYERARRIFESAYEQHPDQFPLLQKLVALDLQLDDRDRAAQRVDQAAPRFPDHPIMKLMQQQLAEGGDPVVVLEAVLKDQEDPVKVALSLATLYEKTGRIEAAQQQLHAAGQLKPNDRRILEAKMNLALVESDFDEAMSIAEQARSLNLDQADGSFWIGRVEIAQQRYPQAIATLTRGLNLHRHDVDGWRMLGDAHRLTGDNAEASAAYNRALEIRPNSVLVLQRIFSVQDAMGAHEQALDALSRAHHFSPTDQSVKEAYWSYLGQHGDAEQALSFRRSASEQDPDDQTNQRAIANLLIKLGRLDEARDVLDALLGGDGQTDLMNIAAMAAYYRAAGWFDDGLALLQQHVDRRGDDVTSDDWIALARYQRAAGQYPSARAAYQHAVRLETDPFLAASRELGDWLFSIGDYPAAVEQYQRIAGHSDGLPESRAWQRLIEALIYAGRLDTAAGHLDQFTQTHGRNVQEVLLEGLIQAARGNHHRAAQAFDRAVNIGPDFAPAYYFRARHRFEDPDETTQAQVKDDLLAAIRIDPSRISAHDLLVEWHLHPRRSDMTSAIIQLQQWIQVDPDNLAPRVQLASLMLARQYPQLRDVEALLDESAARLPRTHQWHDLRAQLRMRQGRSADALTEWAHAFRMSPSPNTLMKLAAGLLEAGEHQQVLQLFDERPDWIDRSVPLMAMRGRALAANQQPDEAMILFTRAFAFSQGRSDLLNMIALSMRQHLTADQIFQMLEQQVTDDPTSPSALVLASAYAGADRVDDALSVLTRLAEQADDGSALKLTALRTLALMQEQSERYTDVRGNYERILALSPNDAMTLNNLAYLLCERLNDPAAAQPLAQRAVNQFQQTAAYDPLSLANTLDTLGRVQYRLGDLDRAEVTLRKGLRLSPVFSSYVHLGQLLLDRHQPRAAMEQFQIALQMAQNGNDDLGQQQVEQWIQRIHEQAASR